ncbi:pentatricopeptide repeat-containing protein At5g66631 [Nymphaea colorata]|uniref:Pentacotripeptide-repeat region of PRORP domain-containing protein n=1 Tax=Nymphaea colorata TaxID=210225 RepID=A0A5K1BRW4_9MAGN|nr:pentatricopeptide repeat-containing protein At5g66631 [Nymphaea colorata]XP_031479569.1 pentatricopeptide repeat-containing protein At5g66631 [Nymphaea colorata]XP_031479570.1 pentatricopeptide repeat-containing protein At5g66631 [Nymphaea colorata]XP_031479571.1 pentatricopeptide repeat-containing protein At5g66631 [Nymphaea colorata]XP_031479572.1 pentatricopeptide repeat-containing protein At5g66631 [Nymphaea colorata]
MNSFSRNPVSFVNRLHDLFAGLRFFSSGRRRLRSRRKKDDAVSEPNSVSLYLRRAKVIDALRLLLRSPAGGAEDSIRGLASEIDTFVASQVIRGSPSPESAISFFDLLRTIPGYAHNQHTCHSLAKRLSNSGRAAELRSFIRAIESGEYEGVSVSFMDLLRWHSGTGDLEAAVNVWMEMKSFYEKNFSAKRPCTESYNILLDLYAEKGKHVEATRLFLYMVKQGALPNPRTYTIIMKHLVKIGKVGEAMEIFKRLPAMRMRRTSKQYLLLIDTFMSVGDAQMVKTLIGEMRKDGVLPSRGLMSSVKLLQESGFTEEADEIVRKYLPDSRIGSLDTQLNVPNDMFDDEDEDDDQPDEDCDDIYGVEDDCDRNGIASGLKLKPWIDPNALASCLKNWNADDVSALENAKFVWTTTLVSKVLRGLRKADTAWEFFCWVSQQPGFTHDIYTVSRMIVMLARQGNFDLVDRLIEKVKSEGIQLSPSTVRLLIEAYGRSKNADAALKVFRKLMSSLFGFKPSLLLYSSLVRALTKGGRATAAVDLLEEMMLMGINPDIQTYSGLMQHFAREGDVRQVQQLFGMMRQSSIEPDAHTCCLLINAYCKNERSALALRVFEDMVTAGLEPDASTKAFLVKSLWKEGKLREAAIVEERIGDGKDLPRSLLGHVWSVNSSDLMHVYSVYAKCFTKENAAN